MRNRFVLGTRHFNEFVEPSLEWCEVGGEDINVTDAVIE
jgi:hypothetical protein